LIREAGCLKKKWEFRREKLPVEKFARARVFIYKLFKYLFKYLLGALYRLWL
jgi:hypothetical protein